MTTPASGPALGSTASKLLGPKRLRQIDIWLDEVHQYESLQSCATDRRHGQAPDQPSSTAPPSPSRRPLSRLSSSSTTSSNLTSTPAQCPVCSRHLWEPDRPGSKSSQLTTKAPSAVVPVADKRPRSSVLKGLRAAVLSLRVKDAAEESRYDPALSTRMFSAQTGVEEGGGTNGVCSKKASAARPREADEGDEEQEEEEEESSSDGGADVEKKLMAERKARLRRAQKLLEKAQVKEKG